jgi:2-iminobutanoate/2-iminopropanoate deaminase
MPNERAWHPVTAEGALDIPYSPLAVDPTHVHVSGQISVDAAGEVVADGFASQAARVFANLAAALASAGASMDDVVHVTTYLVRRGDFAAFNDAMRAAFSPPYPARCTVLADLIVEGLLIEVSAVAVRRP